ncbi:MAG: hypothetical protein QUV05_21990 [Phycisphaerae bacterium]|nr:hypothetical protein [Phycisphaerae bacterium]
MFRRLLLVLDIVVMAAFIGVTVKYTLILLGLPSWTYYIALVLLAAALYCASCFLLSYFIAKNAPEFASKEEVLPGVQLWELSAGLRIVPKWVSLIGIAPISCLLALLLPVIAPMFR